MKFPASKNRSICFRGSQKQPSASRPSSAQGCWSRWAQKPVPFCSRSLQRVHAVSLLGSLNRRWRILPGQLDFQRKSGWKLPEVTLPFLLFLHLQEERTGRQCKCGKPLYTHRGKQGLPGVRAPVTHPGWLAPVLVNWSAQVFLEQVVSADSPVFL